MHVYMYISFSLSLYIRHRAVGTVACSNSRRRLQSLSPIIQSLQIQLQWESQSGDPVGVGASSSSCSRSLESPVPVWSFVGGDPPPCRVRVRPLLPPRSFQFLPPAVFFAYVAPSRVIVTSSCHQDAPTSPKIAQKAPSWSQHLPK